MKIDRALHVEYTLLNTKEDSLKWARELGVLTEEGEVLLKDIVRRRKQMDKEYGLGIQIQLQDNCPTVLPPRYKRPNN